MLDIKVPNWNEENGFYPGTNNIANQPPVGYEQNEQLNMDSPLYPFKFIENGGERYYRSSDVFNIESQLGLTYDNLSIDNNDGTKATLDFVKFKRREAPKKSEKILVVDGINRALINGSFVLTAYATIKGERYFIGTESVLSRWKVVACRNCMTHLEVTAIFSLHQFSKEDLLFAIFEIQINGRKSNEAEFAKFKVVNQVNINNFINSKIGGDSTHLNSSVMSSLNKQQTAYKFRVI